MQNFQGQSNSEELKRTLPLLRDASAGRLQSLECPNCGRHSVEVWFTNPRTARYLVWFICSDCPFYVRVQSERPPYYSDERRSPELEYYDDRLLREQESGPDPGGAEALREALEAARRLPDP